MDPRIKSYDLISKDGCIQVGIEVYPPYTNINGTEFFGTCLFIFDMIMKKLGFCYFLNRPFDKTFGNGFPNGSWNGLVGMLQRNEIEMAVCPIARTYLRYKVMDFSEHVTSTTYGIMYPRPTIQPNYLGFVMPFNLEAWMAILAILIVIAGFTSAVKRFSPIGREDRRNDEFWKKNMSFNLTDLWVYRGLFAQPIDRQPRGNGGRLLMAFWLALALIIAISYKSNLKALIIVPKGNHTVKDTLKLASQHFGIVPRYEEELQGLEESIKVDIPFNTLEGLVNQKKFKWAFLANSIVSQYVKDAYEVDPNSVLGKVWDKKFDMYTSPSQIEDFVFKKKMACIEPVVKITSMMSDDFSAVAKCRIAAATETFFSVDLSNGLRKGSKIKDLFDPYIMRMKEAGILHKILYTSEVNASYCNVPPGKETGLQLRAFEVEDFIGMFSILLIGWLVATLVFICELLLKKFGRKTPEIIRRE